MIKKILKLGEIETKKQKFHSSKSPIAIVDVDIDKILISDKFQYFFGYKNDEKISPLCIKLHTKNGYVNSFRGTKYIPFFIKNYPLL